MPVFIALVSLLSLIFGNDEAEIVFAGDAMMHKGQIEAAKRGGDSYDFSEYFPVVRDYISMADYAVVNLETPVSTPPYSGYPCFNSPAQYLDALKDAGFDLFLTANNHTLDRHDRGLKNTIDSLDSRRLSHIGTYKSDSVRSLAIPFIREINGIKVGFLNYTYGTNGITPGKEVKVDYIDREKIRQDVEATSQSGAEFIFACVHWGNEYQLLPHPSQRSLDAFMKEAGVDAVIGSHPHVIQPFELTDNHLTVFSLGNFISDMRTGDTRGGAIVKVKLKRDENRKIVIDGVTYRLVFTEPADGRRNFRLNWADRSKDSRAKAFSSSARSIFNKYNINVAEELLVR